MKFVKLVTLCSVLAILQGCAAVAVVGATGAVTSSAQDRRTLGAQIDDNSIELKAEIALQKLKNLSDNSRIVIKSVNGNLLVVGQSPNAGAITLAVNALKSIEGVKRVHNQVKVGNTTSMSTRTMDTWITTRVKLKLLTEENLNSNNISVLTENAEVFLMGLVSEDEATKAAEVARNISGVAKVIKVFEIL